MQRVQGDALAQLAVMLRAGERAPWDGASQAASAQLGGGPALVVVELTTQRHTVAGAVGLGPGLGVTRALSARASPARPVLARDASLILSAAEARRWGLEPWVDVIRGQTTVASPLRRDDRAIGALVAVVDAAVSERPGLLEPLEQLARGVSEQLTAPAPGAPLGPVDPRTLGAAIEAAVLDLGPRIERLDRLVEQLWPALDEQTGPALAEVGPQAAEGLEEIGEQLGSLRQWLAVARQHEPPAWEGAAGALLLLGRAVLVLRPALALARRLGAGGLEREQAREAWWLMGAPEPPPPLSEACARLAGSLQEAGWQPEETG